MTIARRLVLLTLLPLVVLGGVSFLGWQQLRLIQRETDYLAAEITPMTAKLGHIGHARQTLRLSVDQMAFGLDPLVQARAREHYEMAWVEHQELL
jgi:hypothetical protein